MKSTEWVMANKVKTGLGLVAAVAGVVVLPLKIQAWAEEIAKEEALRAEGREQVIHSKQMATHQYDFYSLRVEEAEEDLVYLEEKAAETELTPTEQRKMRKLEADLHKFEEKQVEALEQLQELEHDTHETN
jgi:hypothetical protein